MKRLGFVHVLETLAPRLDSLVLTGGWAWYLYRKYLTGERALPSEFTLDVDIVAPRELSGEPVPLDKLLEAGEFESRMEGDERPPVTRHLWPRGEVPEAIVEFLTPMRGSGELATLEIAGVVAQQLRYMDLLLYDPLTLEIDEESDRRRFMGEVRVPRVGLYVWQKALTFTKRKSTAKRDKDLFYIFDLADSSRNLIPRIGNDLALYATSTAVGWRKKAAENLRNECGTVEARGIGRVLSQIPEERRPPRRYVHETFAAMIRLLSGPP